MRPRKRIAVIAAGEMWRDAWGYTLHVWGYKAWGFATAADLLYRLGAPGMDQLVFDGVLAWLPGEKDWPALGLLESRGVRVIAVCERSAAGVASVTLERSASEALIRERLRALVSRKRGPKKAVYA